MRGAGASRPAGHCATRRPAPERARPRGVGRALAGESTGWANSSGFLAQASCHSAARRAGGASNASLASERALVVDLFNLSLRVMCKLKQMTSCETGAATAVSQRFKHHHDGRPLPRRQPPPLALRGDRQRRPLERFFLPGAAAAAQARRNSAAQVLRASVDGTRSEPKDAPFAQPHRGACARPRHTRALLRSPPGHCALQAGPTHH